MTDRLGNLLDREDRDQLRARPRAGARRHAGGGGVRSVETAAAFAREHGARRHPGPRLGRGAGRRPGRRRRVRRLPAHAAPRARPGGAGGRQGGAVREAADPQRPPGAGSWSTWPASDERFFMEACGWPATRSSGCCATGWPRAGSARPKQVHADLGFVVDRPAGDRLRDPGAGRRRAARHGHLPADLRPPDAGRGRVAHGRPRCSPTPASTSTSRSPGATRAARSRR